MDPLPPLGLATVRDRVNHMDDASNRRNNRWEIYCRLK